jgi:hypothetical protein
MRLVRIFSSFLMILMVISIIPSLAFAAEDNYRGFAFGNFSEAQTSLLNAINNEIARLQGTAANVTAATNMSELQTTMCKDRMLTKPHGMNRYDNGFSLTIGKGFRFNTIENVNDTTFSNVQTNMVSSLQNMTMIFQNQENVSLANNETAKATQIANKITMVQGLINNISQATNATGIQSVVLTFMQGQISDSVNKQIAQLQSREANVTDINVTASINTRITNLQTFETNINNVTSFSAFQKVFSSYYTMFPFNNCSMRHCGFRGYRRSGCM